MKVQKLFALIFVSIAFQAHATPDIAGTYSCQVQGQSLTSQIAIDVNGREVRFRGIPGGSMSALESAPIVCENKKSIAVEENNFVKTTAVTRCSNTRIRYGVLMEFADGSSIDIQAQIARLSSRRLRIDITEVDQSWSLKWTTTLRFECQRIKPRSFDFLGTGDVQI